MSVQFGAWNFDGRPPSTEYVEGVASTLIPYGPDERNFYSNAGLTIVHGAFCTTKESRGEVQPHCSRSGAVIVWDGRLDNRGELRGQVGNTKGCDCTDVSLVALAYEQWGTDCFAKLIGDWAVSIWSPRDHSLILARDPVGVRQLYYTLDENGAKWCTILDPLVLGSTRPLKLDEEYIAGWFSLFPAANLTPYAGIQSVPPSAFVHIQKGMRRISEYWRFNPYKRIVHRSDPEYEEHFRDLFAQSVRRRLRSDAPIVAELSGGMDSSCIVCIADTLMAGGSAEAYTLQTVSYYNDSEPNWNERPYFTKVEEKRGRAGCHINVGPEDIFKYDRETECFAAAPGSVVQSSTTASRLATCLTSHGSRVILSGIGGDEVMGGVPTPTPELADLVARLRLSSLAHQLKMWASAKRVPWFHLLIDTARGFFPPDCLSVSQYRKPAPWLDPEFIRRHRSALTGYESRSKVFGPLPSFQGSVDTLNALRRQLGCYPLPTNPTYEKRYPYLDRDLLEFLFAVPRSQLVRPNQRRSLMRRAMIGIVPDELLNRKRKGFVTRTPLAGISLEWNSLVQLSQEMLSSSLGIVNASAFRETLQVARRGVEVPIVPLTRTLSLELWLRGLKARSLLTGFPPVQLTGFSHQQSVRTVAARTVRAISG
jgi:asparagine synthase (glutamine-hydrolysing)